MGYAEELEQWRRQRALGLRQLVALLAAPLLLLALAGGLRSCNEARRVAELKGNLHDIQLAVERFAVDSDGSYPAYIDEVIGSDYLPELPRNPYNGGPMRPVSDPAQAQPGDFNYIASELDPGDPTRADMYRLVLYLPER